MSVAAAPALPFQANAPVRKLYRHVLESIFTLATLSELHHINAVSREWSSAVMSMKPIAAPARVHDRAGLVRLLGGSLCRHTGSLIFANRTEHYRVDLAYADDFPSLAEACGPSLTVLRTRVRVEIPEQTRTYCLGLDRFQQLRDLRFDGRASYWHRPIDGPALAAASNRIVETIGRLNPATMHTLVLQLPFSADLSFAPLSALTRLCDFSFRFDVEDKDPPLTDRQIEELRTLSSVQQLRLPYTLEAHTEFLTRMLQPGHALQWTRHDDGYRITITPPLAALISSLPTLTALWAGLDCSNVHFLAALRALTELHLVGGRIPIDSGELVRSLSHCSQLETLILEQFDLTGRHLEDLLPAFPLLSSCCLSYFSQVESLRCFSTPGLAASLTWLNLFDLSRCPPTEASRLLGLRSSMLFGNLGLSAPLSEELRAQFRERFPALRESHPEN